MAYPLTWNKPGLSWNQPGATWNGAAATSPKPMTKTKAIVDFSGYSGPELGPLAQSIHDKVTANAATFANPPITMAALATMLTGYTTKLTARASRSIFDTIAFDVARHELEGVLADLGHYVNSVARGDAV